MILSADCAKSHLLLLFTCCIIDQISCLIDPDRPYPIMKIIREIFDQPHISFCFRKFPVITFFSFSFKNFRLPVIEVWPRIRIPWSFCVTKPVDKQFPTFSIHKSDIAEPGLPIVPFKMCCVIYTSFQPLCLCGL